VHEQRDLTTFRMFTSQLVINGNATQAQIARAFGVPLVMVKRYVKLYRRNTRSQTPSVRSRPATSLVIEGR
jgi:adenine/guanine phosphoribosyltransferase-like PRPP-binding protein